VLLEALKAFHGMLEELHVAAAALRDSEARSTAILQTAVDGIITIDERGIIASFNPAAERLFGDTAAEVMGQNVRLLMPSPYREEHDGYLVRYLQTGEQKIIGMGREVRARRRDGTTFPIALAVSEMHLDGRRMFTGIVHDLSARVQAEEALRHAHDELEVRVKERTAKPEAANEEVRRFAYIVSHDLRAPLVNLKGFASELRIASDVLQDALPAVLPHLEAPQHADVARALAQDIPEAMGFIETSVTRMDHLIRAMLHLSRLGRRELRYEPLDMLVLGQETVQTLAHQIAERQVQVTVDPLPTVMADRTAMEQIMGNLLANAVAYLAPGRPGEIVTLSDGQQAVDYLLREHTYAGAAHVLPLLLLLDLNLPGLDGYQVLTRLKADARTRHIPVIILTTTDEPYEIKRCYALGCNVYLTKPIEYEQFAEAMRKLGLFLSIVKLPLGE
jgi:PAS domain S-box-containing protein